MGYVAPIISGAGQVVEGVAAKGAADAQSDMIGYNTRNQVDAERQRRNYARGAQVAQAGASGLELTSGSFMKVFEQNAIEKARTLADMKYAGKVAQAQVEQEGTNALVGGIISGIATAGTGILAQKQYKQWLATQDEANNPSFMTVRDKVRTGKIKSVPTLWYTGE